MLIRLQIGDVVPRSSVKRLVEPALVNVVANEAGRTAEDEDGVQYTTLDVTIGLLAMNKTTKSFSNFYNKVIFKFQIFTHVNW